MTKHEQLRGLARLCRRFGGRLAIVSQAHFDRLFERADRYVFSESPFTCAHGLHWQKKIVYAVRGREEVGSIIHEMGHVFVDRRHPESGKSREWAWFGWEVAVARLVGAGRVWSQQNANYNTDEKGGAEWKGLSTKERRVLITERLAHAKKIRILDSSGSPRSIR